jgi:hypothetical protein
VNFQAISFLNWQRVGAGLLLGISCVFPLWAQTAPPAVLPNHVILLIDDSLDAQQMMEPGAPPIIPAILEALFEQGGRTDFPVLRPGRDRLSLVFFTIHKVSTGCNGTKRTMSASLEGLFEGISMASAPSADELRLTLDNQLSQSCRFRGYLSPINTAPKSALPFVQRWLSKGSLYQRTVIVLLTNSLTNTGAPARELESYQVRYGVTDVSEAIELAQVTAAKIQVVDHSEWRRQVGRFALTFHEALPVAQVDDAVVYSSTMRVEPRAFSQAALRLVADRPTALLRADGFTPVSLSLRFADAHGEPWQVGDKTAPSEVRLDLQSCRPPTCSRDANGVTVQLLEAALPGSTVPAESPELQNGVVRLKAGFRLNAPGLYEALFAETSEKTVLIVAAPPPIVRGPLLWPFPVQLGNRGLTAWYPGEGELTREQARQRIETAFARRSAAVLAVLVAAVALLMVRLVRRRFEPVLEWQGRESIELSFGERGNRVLVGRMIVRNRAAKSLLSRLGLETSPRRRVKLTAVAQDLNALGLLTEPGCILGFAAEEGNPDLTGGPLEIEISDGRELFLFLAGEKVVDVSPSHIRRSAAGYPEWTRSVSIAVQAHWGVARGQRPGSAACTATIELRGLPQPAAVPRVAFQPASVALHFAKGSRLEIGRFVFLSNATRHFAVPFRGTYNAKLRRGEKTVGGEPVALERSEVEIVADPGRTRPIALAAILLCDGKIVPHPDATSESYAVTLLGPTASNSSLGPHPFDLGRDLHRAELQLGFLHSQQAWEVYWEEELGRFGVKGSAAGAAEESPTFTDGSLSLAPQEIRFERRSDATYVLLTLRIGNSATAGSGRVEATLQSHLEVSPAAIHVKSEAKHDDLLGFRDPNSEAIQRRLDIVVSAGDTQVDVDLIFRTSPLARIPKAVVDAGACRALVRGSFVVADGQDENSTKQMSLMLMLPLRIEQLPDSSWLCIDFGTSAIAATIGSVAGKDLHSLDLQQVSWTGFPEDCLAKVDPGNSEARTKLLPSSIILDGDIRKGRNGAHPGTPYAQGSTVVEDPAFLALPAQSAQMRGPEVTRVVHSIKTWLTRQRNELPLAEAIRCQPRGAELLPRTRLPLDEILQAMFSSLVEGYLAPDQLTAEQVVLTHPNTFTRFHRDRLRRIAFQALSRSISFPRPERIHLMSESDAVAYYYCHLASRGHAPRPRQKLQTLLIYDCGSGTLDLSLIQVLWSLEELVPLKWTVRSRIGVAVAGDYLDETLLRIIHERLLAFEAQGKCRYEAHHPLVALRERPGNEKEHRQSVSEFGGAIRRAKQIWKGDGDFEVTVGLRGIPSRSIVDPESVGSHLAGPASGGASLGFASADVAPIVLRLAADTIHAHPRLAAFRQFVTVDVIDELLAGAARPVEGSPHGSLGTGRGCDPSEIDVVLVAGRGALWPGLREAIWERFPEAEQPQLSNEEMKHCVATGAVAWHEFGERLESFDLSPAGILGLLHNEDAAFVPMSEWSRPTRLVGPTFRFAQVNCQTPNPAVDLDKRAKTLRRHFYVPLAEGLVRTARVSGPAESVTLKLIPNDHHQLRVLVSSNDPRRPPSEVELEQGALPPAGLAARLLEPELS